MASSSRLLVLLLSMLLSSPCSRAKYEPAGCSDEGCGIPCYMRPVEDPCHYQPHSPCNEEGSTDLEQWLGNLNSSLHRLENKLIQKGVSKLIKTHATSELYLIHHIATRVIIITSSMPHTACMHTVIIMLNKSNSSISVATFAVFMTVPAGDTCKPLSPIDHGGIIYSDLILSTGVIANYVCEDGYSVYGNPSRTCGTDGNWIGSESDDPVCEGMESTSM